MASAKYQDLVFKHLVALKHPNGVYCSTAERRTGKRHLFLIFQSPRKIYKRNALRETWDPLTDSGASEHIHRQLSDVIQERKIPCFSRLGVE